MLSVKESKRNYDSMSRIAKNEKILRDLKDSQAGRECLLVGCGPSIKKIPTKKIHNFSEGKCLFTVKQAHNLMEEASDFHFLNDNNLSSYSYSRATVVVSENCQNVKCPFLEISSDLHFIVAQNLDIEKSLGFTYDFDRWTLNKEPYFRPFGPGILSELVLFFVKHLGFKTLYSVGVDLGPPEQQKREHYYTEETQLEAHSMHLGESAREIELMGAFHRWFKSQNIEWVVASPDSYLPKEIERIKL